MKINSISTSSRDTCQYTHRLPQDNASQDTSRVSQISRCQYTHRLPQDMHLKTGLCVSQIHLSWDNASAPCAYARYASAWYVSAVSPV